MIQNVKNPNDLVEVELPFVATGTRVVSFGGSEAISEVSKFEVELDLTESVLGIVAISDALKQSEKDRQPIQIKLKTKNGQRVFRGLVDGVSLDFGDENRICFGVQSQIGLLENRINSRSFVDKKLAEIIQLLMRDHGIEDFDTSGINDDGKFSLLQYNESDLSFLNRILADEGVVFFLKEGIERTTVCFSNQSAWEVNDEQPIVSISKSEIPGQARNEDYLCHLVSRSSDVPAAIEVSNSDHKHPDAKLCSRRESLVGGRKTDCRIVNFSFPKTDQTQKSVLTFQDAADSLSELFQGSGPIRTLRVGHTTAVKEIPLMITAQTFSVTTGFGNTSESYHCSFFAIPALNSFRTMPAMASVPEMLEATICDAKGDVKPCSRSYTNNLGQVKIRFPWDVENGRPSTDWVDVGIPWAGPNHGTLHLPRIGDKVWVTFLNGDLGRPCVISSVFGPGSNWPVDPKKDGTAHATLTDLNRIERVGGDVDQLFEGDFRSQVKGSSSEKVLGNQVQHVEGLLTHQSDKDMSLETQTTLVLKAKKSILIEADGSSIVIDSSGVWINGTKVGLNSGGPTINQSKQDSARVPNLRQQKQSPKKTHSPKKESDNVTTSKSPSCSTWEHRKRAAEYSKLAYADRVTEDQLTNAGLGGVEVVDEMSLNSGLQYKIFHDEERKEIVYAFRGTEKWNEGGSRDWETNILQDIGIIPRQYRQARYLIENAYVPPEYKIVVTGHSLGGGLAQYAAGGNPNVDHVQGFNAAGLGTGARVSIPGQENIENVNIEGDPLSNPLGKTGIHASASELVHKGGAMVTKTNPATSAFRTLVRPSQQVGDQIFLPGGDCKTLGSNEDSCHSIDLAIRRIKAKTKQVCRTN